jgi:glycosyltransferase involved in cell wall biosynthesis
MNKTTIAFYTLYYIVTLSVVYFVFIGLPLWDGFFYWVWKAIRSNYLPYGFLIFILLEAAFTLIPALLYRRRHVNEPKQPCGEDVALIIPCHKAEGIIGKTLEHALKVFAPKKIYVVDNGNADSPLDNTRQVCEELGVNYVWVPVGNKLAAIYTGAKVSNARFVMQIDDDVFLNEDMTFPVTDETHCIAYMISATNHNGERKLIHHIQDMEYKHSGIIKGFQSWAGSTMFAHGAISLWRCSTLLTVLDNHAMYSMSDDWFTGFKANDMGYRIDVCDRGFVNTDAPSTWFTASRQGGYGNADLFSQRFGRWYRTRLVQIFYMVYYLVCSWSLPLRVLLVQKLFFLWDIFNSLLNLAKIWVFVFYVLYDWKFTLVMAAASVGLSVIGFVVFNYHQLRSNERLPWWIILVFPLYALYDTFVFVAAVLYSLVVIPRVLFHKSQKLTDNEKIQAVIAAA